MQPNQLAEVICAAHLAHYVEGTLSQRGGLFLVGPPGALKSTMIEALAQYPDALQLSDVNMTMLADLRDSMAGGTINTLVFPEYAKVYERNPQTAANIEGTLRALVSEGFQGASFQDHRIARRRAYAAIVGALPTATVEKHFKRWEDTGFNRRFLWAVYSIKGAHVLDEAASELRRLDFGVHDLPRVPPLGKTIPMLLTKADRAKVASMVKYQPGGAHTQHIQLFTRIWSVLRWWHRERGTRRDGERTLSEFAKALSHEGTELDLMRPRK